MVLEVVATAAASEEVVERDSDAEEKAAVATAAVAHVAEAMGLVEKVESMGSHAVGAEATATRLDWESVASEETVTVKEMVVAVVVQTAVDVRRWRRSWRWRAKALEDGGWVVEEEMARECMVMEVEVAAAVALATEVVACPV